MPAERKFGISHERETPLRHLLLVALGFPPSTSAAAVSAAQLATHLHAFGWFPTVLTARTEHLRWAVAEDQASEPPAEHYAIHRTRLVYPWRNMLTFPDSFSGWYPFAVAGGLSVARMRRVDCLFSTGPPWTAHLVAMQLKRKLRCLWVAEFRDPWTANPWRAPVSRMRERREARLEARIFANAEVIAVRTPEMAEAIAARAGREVQVIPGAYDLAEIAAAAQEAKQDPNVFVLVHAGRFYGPRSPVPLLTALAKVAQASSSMRLELRLVGEHDALAQATAERLGIGQLLRQVGRCSHRDVLRHILESDLAVLVQPGTTIQIPAKLYDYLGCHLPILALTEEGAAARMVREAKAGVIASPHDVPAIEKALRNGIEHVKTMRDQINREYVAQYEVGKVVEGVARVLNRMTA